MSDAIGMVETKGLVPMVQATDAMLKTAKVTYQGWKKVGSGFCTGFVSGDVGAVQAAVDAGAAAFDRIRIKERRTAPSAQGGVEFPRQVDGITDPGVSPEATARRHQGRGIAGAEC